MKAFMVTCDAHSKRLHIHGLQPTANVDAVSYSTY